MSKQKSPPSVQTEPTPSDQVAAGGTAGWSPLQVGLLVLLGSLFIWSYWPTIEHLVQSWWNIDDYSHGFLVIPVAGLFLYLRRDSMPDVSSAFYPAGLALILAAAGLRWIGASWFIEALDGWSMIVWIAGLVWICGGWALVKWALPSIGFLFFMVPLPYTIETALSVPLQRVATMGSSWILQSLGQPALREGTTIVIGDMHLDVNRACAGLRMFIGVLALAYVFIVLSRRPWWDKAILFVGAIPVAIASNIVRITLTALLYQLTDSKDVRQSIHDNAGFFTILVAALFLGILAEYLKRLVVETQVMTSRDLLRAEPG